MTLQEIKSELEGYKLEDMDIEAQLYSDFSKRLDAEMARRQTI